MLPLCCALVLAPVPRDPTKTEPPTVKHTGTIARNGRVLLQFEMKNPNAAPLHYSGYTSDSFEGGLQAGVISPLYRLELKLNAEWKTKDVGWCKTGVGPVTIPGGGTGTFEVLVPEGEWDAARFGVTWFTRADRKVRDVAWVIVARKETVPKEP